MTLERFTWLLGCALGLALLPSQGAAQRPPDGPEFRIEKLTFTRLAEPAQYIHVVGLGHGYQNRWQIQDVYVGLTRVLALAVFPDGKGFSGLLPPDVVEGAVVALRVAPNTDLWTPFNFHQRDVGGVAQRSQRFERCSRTVRSCWLESVVPRGTRAPPAP